MRDSRGIILYSRVATEDTEETDVMWIPGDLDTAADSLLALCPPDFVGFLSATVRSSHSRRAPPGPTQVNIVNNKTCIHCKKHYPCRFWQMFDWLLFEIHDGSRWYCLIERLAHCEKLQEMDKNQCPNMSLEFHYVHTMGVKYPLDRTLWSP